MILDGLLTQAQVDGALQNQLLSGGTIGTSLLDLGHIDEDVLGETLASILRIRHVSHERLRDIPAHVIAQLPGHLAEKHHAIPIELDAKTLHVAAVHPKLLGSLSRLTGFKIVTWLAPEVRIYEALETYYGIPMRPRYVRIVKDLDARRESHARKLREMAAAPIDRDERRVLEPKPNWVKEFRRIEDVFERFCEANFKEELFEAALGYISRELETTILFGVRNQLAHVLDLRGKRFAREDLEKHRLPLAGGSIFSLLLGRTFYRGSPKDDDASGLFYNMLKVDPPAEVLLLPVYVNDRLVAVVYGDNGDKPIVEDTANYRLLAEKLSAAFNLLTLKMKIRA